MFDTFLCEPNIENGALLISAMTLWHIPTWHSSAAVSTKARSFAEEQRRYRLSERQDCFAQHQPLASALSFPDPLTLLLRKCDRKRNNSRHKGLIIAGSQSLNSWGFSFLSVWEKLRRERELLICSSSFSHFTSFEACLLLTHVTTPNSIFCGYFWCSEYIRRYICTRVRAAEHL